MPLFLPFRPDAGELLSSEVSDVFMTSGGYGPRPVLAAAPGAAVLAAAPRGVYGGFLPDGTFKGFVATAAEAYLISATYTFTALSASLSLAAGEEQAFTQFGVFMLTSNTSDGMQAYNMSVPAGLNAVSGAPAARVLFTANNQVVALGDGTSLLNRLGVSGFGDHTNWTTKGASKQDMNDGGAFTGGGDLGNGVSILLQLRAVRKMTFGNAGGGALFRLDKLADDVGCVHPRAQATYNGVVYFLHTDGFYSCNGGTPVNIGAGKVNKWFLARCPDLTKVSAAIDPKNTIVRFRYPASGDGSTSTVYNSYLDYNWTTGEFVPGTEPAAAMFRMGTPGYVLNDLDSFGQLDDWSQYPLGSAVWQGGNFRLAGITSALKVGFFDGSNAAATLETATEGDGRTYLVNWCEPLTDDTAATVSLAVKDAMSDSLTYKTAAAKQTSGRVPLRGRGRYIRLKLNHAAGASWTKSTAIEGIVKSPGGPR
jgi:hypothetical protein